jgi:hypothetical protein
MACDNRAWLAVLCAACLSSGVGVVRAQSSTSGLPSNMTLTCHFTGGPRSGQTFDFSNTPGVTPAPIGAPCTDGQGSYGVAVAPGSSGQAQTDPAGQAQSSPSGNLPQGTTLTCHFTGGPRSGQTFDFSNTPGVAPAPIGAPCTDGQGSYGVAVAPGSNGAAQSSSSAPAQPTQSRGGNLPQGKSLTCRFTYGPRSGQTIDFSNVPGATPARIGASCTDGQGSWGVAVQ